MNMFCYLNDKILLESEAQVSIFDIGLLRGFGIYEAMTAIGGSVFMLEEHLARFRKSAEFLEITVPKTDAEIKTIILELLKKNGFTSENKRANIKFILTGGNAIGGIDFNRSNSTFYVFLEEWTPLDPSLYTDGTRLLIHEHLREYPQYKTINYISAVPLQQKMKKAHALETLYTWSGQVLECATSNFFIVEGEEIRTPKDRILEGITRRATIDLARANGLNVVETNISLVEAFAADECFITSSFKDIVPVVEIGGRHIGNGKVGKITQYLKKLFDNYLYGRDPLALAFRHELNYSSKH